MTVSKQCMCPDVLKIVLKLISPYSSCCRGGLSGGCNFLIKHVFNTRNIDTIHPFTVVVLAVVGGSVVS